ncbi:MAG: SIS domain-containing protein [Propionivibrio sp.]
MTDDDMLRQSRAVIAADARAVAAAESALDGSFCAAANAVASCKGKILIVGCGTSGNIAERAAHIFSVAGTPAFSISPEDGLHGGLGVLQTQDVVIAISNGGQSAELNEFCKRSKALAGCPVIAITSALQSPFAELADHVISLELPDDADFGGVIATGSTLAAAAITDALAAVSHRIRGYSWEKVFYSHPSGAVGSNADEMLQRLRGATGSRRSPG